jgi:hypothetical protein
VHWNRDAENPVSIPKPAGWWGRPDVFEPYVLREGEMQSLNVRQVATGSDVQILPPDVVSFGGLTFSPVGIPRPQIGRLDQPRYPLPY